MSSELSVKEFYFIYYFLFSLNSCNRCAIPYDDVEEDKVGLKVEYGEDKKERDEDDLEVSDKDVDGKNDNEEEYRPKNTKEEITNNLSFVKGVVDSNNLLPLNFNRETRQESKIIKVISKKPLRKAIEMLRKIAEKDEPKKEKEDDIEDKTKDVEINNNREVAEADNGNFFVDAVNDALPPQEAPATTTITAAAAEEVRDDEFGAKGGKDNGDEVDYTKGGEEGGDIPRSKTETTKMTKTRRRECDGRFPPLSRPYS